MFVAVVGAGALGRIYGLRLATAGRDHRVAFVVRPRRLHERGPFVIEEDALSFMNQYGHRVSGEVRFGKSGRGSMRGPIIEGPPEPDPGVSLVNPRFLQRFTP